jgi:Superinfection immunity protein
MGNTIENVVSLALVLALVLFVVAVLVATYLLPTIVAVKRDLPNTAPLVIVNVFLGWTLIGWVLALALAVRDVPNQARVAR